jgi:RecA-family ATPase
MPDQDSISKLHLDSLRTKFITQLDTAVNGLPKAKRTHSFSELHARKDDQQKFLIPDLLPAESVCLFIGEDGIGKTQLCTQLMLNVAIAAPTVFGLPLKTDSHSCLLVATEDSAKKWIKAAATQIRNIEPAYKANEIDIDFMEASDFDDFETFKTELETELKVKKRALVVLDAFGDLFTLIDGDINSNSHARKLISFLQHLCNIYHTTLVLIHHAAKTKIVARRKEGKLFVEKNDAQGAGAITQKPRTVWALTHDPKSVRNEGAEYTNYLHVVKANLMGKYYQQHAIHLDFQTTTLLHRAKGVVDIEMMQNAASQINGEIPANARKLMPHEISIAEHKQTLNNCFRDNIDLSRADLVKKMCLHYNVGQQKVEQAGGFLNYAIDNGLIEKSILGFRHIKDKPTEPPKQGVLLDTPEDPED